MRYTGFHRLTVVNGTLGFWDVTTCLSLRDVVDDVGFGVEAFRTLDLRPHGKIDVEISVKDLQDQCDDDDDAAAAYSAARLSRYHYRSPLRIAKKFTKIEDEE